MRATRPESIKLNIRQPTKKGERFPVFRTRRVVRQVGRERPPNSGEAKSLLQLGVSGDVGGIVIVDKGETGGLTEDGEGKDGADEAEEDVRTPNTMPVTLRRAAEDFSGRVRWRQGGNGSGLQG